MRPDEPPDGPPVCLPLILFGIYAAITFTAYKVCFYIGKWTS